MDKRDNFKHAISKKFEGFQPKPPPHVWNELEGKLDNDRKSSRKRYVKYAAAIALLMASAWGVYEIISYNAISFDETADLFSPKHLKRVEITEKIKPDIIHQKEIPDIYKKETVSKTKDPGFLPITKEKTDKKKIAGFVKDTLTPVLHREEFANKFQETEPVKYSKIATSDAIVLTSSDFKENITYTTSLDKETYLDDLPEKNRWSFGVKIAPQYAFRINSSDPDLLFQGRSIFEQNEKHLFTYNLGINVEYKLNKRISVESGLQYIRMGQIIRNIKIYSHPDNKSPFDILPSYVRHPQSVLTSMGEIKFDDPTLYFDDISAHRVITLDDINEPEDDLQEKGDMLNQHLGFLEVPLSIRYNVYNRLFKIQLKGGAGLNYLVNNSVVLEREGVRNSIGKTSLIRNWNISLTGGAAFVVPVTNKLNFYMEPSANLFVTSMTHGKEYNVYPYGISLYTGLTIDL